MVEGPYYGYFWGFGLINAIIGVLIFLFFLWVVLHVIRSFRWNHHYRWWDDEDPIEILKKRYARGEISKEEYERIKADLERDKR